MVVVVSYSGGVDGAEEDITFLGNYWMCEVCWLSTEYSSTGSTDSWFLLSSFWSTVVDGRGDWYWRRRDSHPPIPPT